MTYLPALASCTIVSLVAFGGCVVENTPSPEGSGGAAAQGGSGGTGAASMGGAGGGGGDACYEGTMSTGNESGDWSEPNEDDVYTVTAPADPGGGLLRVRLTADHPELVPSVTIVNANQPGGGAMLGGNSSGTANEQEWNGVFVAWPEQTYEITVTDFFAAPIQAYPVSYQLEWTFEPLVDCYEPNDTLGDAALVTPGETVEAYLVAGYETASTGSLVDHYAVQVDEPGTMTLTLLGQPSTTGITIRAFRPEASRSSGYAQLPGSGEIPVGDSLSWDVVEPGRYVIEVKDSGLDMRALQDEPEPAHLRETYSFRFDVE